VLLDSTTAPKLDGYVAVDEEMAEAACGVEAALTVQNADGAAATGTAPCDDAASVDAHHVGTGMVAGMASEGGTDEHLLTSKHQLAAGLSSSGAAGASTGSLGDGNGDDSGNAGDVNAGLADDGRMANIGSFPSTAEPAASSTKRPSLKPKKSGKGGVKGSPKANTALTSPKASPKSLTPKASPKAAPPGSPKEAGVKIVPPGSPKTAGADAITPSKGGRKAKKGTGEKRGGKRSAGSPPTHTPWGWE